MIAKLKFSFIAFFCISYLSADELTINLSGQTKSGMLSLAVYDNSESYDYSVTGEKRDEAGVFAGIESFIELQQMHKFTMTLPEGKYAIALFIDRNKLSLIHI